MFEINTLVTGPNMLVWAINAAGAVVGCIAAGFLFVKPIRNRILPQMEEEAVGTEIQFDHVLSDRKTIACYEGSLVATLSLEGSDLEAVSEEIMLSWENARKAWIDQLGTIGGLRVIVFSSRRLPWRTRY